MKGRGWSLTVASTTWSFQQEIAKTDVKANKFPGSQFLLTFHKVVLFLNLAKNKHNNNNKNQNLDC